MKQFICSIKNNKKKGFTLTEILVVVMVVAVLAAISYPLYTKAATKSRAIEAINLLEMVRNKQLSKYARDKAYYTTATGLGQLTSNSKHETLSGAVLQVKDYTISLNSVKNCATAAYSKGSTNFSFSSGYDTSGLGCTGDVCSSFGNIVGTAKDVCNCGSKACSNGYTLNEDTCNCDCLLGCDQGGTCYVPYGGGSSRPCSSGCGTENSANSCNGAVWSGTCWSPTQTQPTSQGCGNSGTQTRTCTPSCGGGSCGSWGACTGQTCPVSTKPATSQACGNCGSQTRTVTCNTNTGSWTTGSWGTCGGTGVCSVGATQSCGVGGTQTCTSSCAWGSCGGQDCPAASKPTASEACGNCNLGTRTRTVTCNTSTYAWTSSAWTTCTGGGVCKSGDTQTCNSTGTQTCSSSCSWGTCSVQTCSESTKPTTSQACGNCNTGTQTRTVTCNTSTGTWTSGAWTTCTGGGVCKSGETQTCNSTGTQTCSSSCSWGTCSVQPCAESTKPTTSEACGNCNTGTRTRTVTCNTSTGTWTSGTWSTCTGGGVCKSGDTQTCNSTGTQTCSSSCSWGTCSVVNCNASTKPATSQSCGNCNKGTQIRDVICNTSTGTWTTYDWEPCIGDGTCKPGATQACGAHAQQTCTSSCTWGTCIGSCAQAQKPVDTQVCGNCNTGTQTRTVTCDTSTYTWTTTAWSSCLGGGTCSPGATQACGNCNTGQQACDSSCSWGTCSGVTGCTPGASNTGGCPAGYTGYLIKSCNSSCQWVDAVNNCVATCTNSSSSQGADYFTLNGASAIDTCDGTPLLYFSCGSTAKNCIDTYKISGCKDSSGTSYAPDWTSGGYTYQKGTWSMVTDYYDAPSYSLPTTTCTSGATSMVIGSNISFTDATARSVCQKQCQGIGLPFGLPCSSSCRIVGNCFDGSTPGFKRCQVRDLSCSSTELSCLTAKTAFTCCAK